MNISRNYFDFATIGMTRGCMLMQAYDNEKGAGTMSPYTSFVPLPEPWNGFM